MKKVLMTLAMTTLGGVAAAESGDIYIDIAGGMNFSENTPSLHMREVNLNILDEADRTLLDSDKGHTFHLGAGYALTDNIRIGGRYSYHSSDPTIFMPNMWGTGNNASMTNNRHSHALMAEVAYDFVNSSNFTPYVKAGLGVSRNTHSATILRSGGAPAVSLPQNTETDFAWRLGAGVNYRINKNLSVMAEYQYSDLGSTKTGTVSALPITGNLRDQLYGESDYHVSEVNIGFRFDF